MIIYALDTSWELHKPFVQKSALLSSLVRRAEQTGMHNIDEEEENDTQNITATGVYMYLKLWTWGLSHVIKFSDLVYLKLSRMNRFL